MKVRDVLKKDPVEAKLLNNGVAEVRDIREEREYETLRYELETFVCEGQYEQGLSRILHSYITNLDNPAQPAAWISGFFGSGKSHLAKMLRALWVDFKFKDGATARGLARLPNEIQAQLKELSTAGKRYGGLHAAAGTLGAGAGDSVRLAFLGIVFRSVGLPEKYSFARFVLWLRQQGVEQQVRDAVAAKGKEFEKELNNLYVSPLLAEALIKALPDFATKPADALKAIGTQFPNVKDVTDEELYQAVRDALTRDGKFPCTLVVMDEIQQYIGENPQRAHDVQELVEFCSNKFDGKLLVVGTGQMALNSTPQLKKIQARFTVSIALSDTDVEAVIRKIVLAKRPDRTADVQQVLEKHSGEISRQLDGTRIRQTAADHDYLVSDYPLLPVRRRFWERVLRAVDSAGTTGQLRTQLRVVHDAVRDVAERPIGWVVPADYLYTELDHQLLSSGVLLREVRDDIIEKQRNKTVDGELRARLCSLIFLIGKLPREQGSDDGIRATADMLADLMVEDLNEGSNALRMRIPELLQALVDQNFLIEVEGEYRLQTKESAAWNNDYQVRYSQFVNDEQRMLHERAHRLRAEANERLGGVKLHQGKTKTPRKVQLFFGRDAPEPNGQAIPVWIRDGWEEDEKSVLNDARQAGTKSALVYVFIPKRGAEDLKKAVAALLASKEVLDLRPSPNTPEGNEAREAMLTRNRDAQVRVRQAMEILFGGAQVYLAGGEQYHGMLHVATQEAATAALARLYPQFDEGDDPKWANVIQRVKGGDATLDAIGYKGEVATHPVCAAVLRELGAGKRGSDLRKQFMSEPYGWPQDTIDGALMVLHAAEQVNVKLNGVTVAPKQLDQAKIGPAEFRSEQIVLTAKQKIDLKKLFMELKIACNPGEEAAKAPEFIMAALTLTLRAGGDAPAPQSPSLPRLLEIKGLSGNEQLLELWKEQESLRGAIADWTARAGKIEARLPRWLRLQELLRHADSLTAAAQVRPQVDAVLQGRQLLNDPDPVPALADQLTQALREEICARIARYREVFDSARAELEASDPWRKISAEDRDRIAKEQQLVSAAEPRVGTEEEVLQALDATSLGEWKDRADALPHRFGKALSAAAKLIEPKVVEVSLKGATLRSTKDLDEWIESTKAVLAAKLANGPVLIS